jgi:hypothetical protein
MLALLFFCLSLLACTTQPSSSESAQSICNPDIDNCPGGHPITDAELRGETRSRYGSTAGRVACSAIHSAPGVHYTTCAVSAGGTILFVCTFNYSVSDDGDTTIQSIDCG